MKQKMLLSAVLLSVLSLLILNPTFAGNGKGNGNRQPVPGLGETVGALPGGDLSAAEIDYLIWMREEEKLARDIYRSLYELWGASIFENIAVSEQRHMDAVGALIAKYDELEDPIDDDMIGAFQSPALSDLFISLVADGEVSLEAALWVGATVEDLDIYDLKQALALETVDNIDIRTVFENLLKGSENHIRAFVRLLEASGIHYEATYLAPEELDEILDTSTDRGGRRQASSRNRQKSSGSGYLQGDLRQFTGEVSDVHLETGEQSFPSFSLEDGEEGAVTIIAGPYRSWIEIGFTLNNGDRASVMAFPSSILEDVWVAVSVTKMDAQGNILGDPLILRQERNDSSEARNGNPGAGRGGGQRGAPDDDRGEGECRIEN